MRQDQYERLQKLQDKLMDVFLDEADPEHWPGKGLKIGAMDAQTRGDLYWVRKTAASAGMLYSRVEAMVGRVQMAGAGTTPPAEGDSPEDVEQQMDAELAKYEKEAKAMLADVQSGRAKAKFDKRVHGKP